MPWKRAVRLEILLVIGSLPALSQFAPNRYTLILEDPAVSERYAGRDALQSGEAESYRNTLAARHQDLRGALAARRISVTGSVSTLVNAMFVVATPDRVAELRGLPGVKAVLPQRLYRLALNRAVGLINGPAAWAAAGGVQNAGAGMKIGIIDTGIDPTHPVFQDSSLAVPSGFPKCNVASDCANFTNNKVIVARSYVPMIAAGTNPANPAADSLPDDLSARDHDGHGTSVAAAAAGNSATGTVTISGMAPKAYLGSYKVSGSPGVNDEFPDSVLLSAIQDALHDGMDVVNFSGGAPAVTGPLDTGAVCGQPAGVFCDPVAHAFEQAAQAGLVVVVSAGNDALSAYWYPNFNSIETPANVPDVITVGATTNAHVFSETVSVPGGASNLQNISTSKGDANAFNPGAVTLALFDVTLLGDNGLACSAIPNVAPYGLYNAVALIKVGTCDPATKVNNAMNAGAAAVILYMADSSPLASPTGLSQLIPAVVVSNADGVNLKNYADANLYGPVTIDPGGSEQADTADQNELASYSSLGPTTGTNAIKPDLVAPGGDTDFSSFFNLIYTAAQNYDPAGGSYSSTRYSAAAGTSLATPLVAGAAALVKQKHPNFTPAQIKSALVNTATQDVQTDDSVPLGFPPAYPVDVQWYGGGKLDAAAALNATVTLTPVSLSFGVVASLPQTLPLQLTNTGSTGVTLNLSYAPFAGQSSSATVTFDQTSVTLAPGASATVKATLSGTLPPSSEYSAFVVITGSGGSLKTPVMYLVANGLQCQYCNVYLLSFDFEGIAGTVFPSQLALKLTDDWGVPIAGAPVTFSASGGGAVQNADAVTDVYGNAYADAVLGSTPGMTTYTASAQGMSQSVTGIARLQPHIPANGVTNAGSLDPSQPIAPGSYIAIGNGNNPGTALSDFTAFNTFARLPLALDPCQPGCAVSVSFDVPAAGISVPGHLTYASSTQINLQAPWELQGQSSAQVKVTFSDTVGDYSFSNVVTVPIAKFSPAFFEIATGVAAAQDSTYAIVTSTHPVQRGSLVILYLNGLGPVTNQPASGDPASLTVQAKTMDTPILMIGGQTADFSFSGLTPSLAGLYQINATVPPNISTGQQTVTVSIGGVTSKASSIFVK